MADSTNPNANKSRSSDFLPRFFRTDANKKFLQATVDQLVQPGTVKKINGYIGRENAKATDGNDIFLAAATTLRQNYQLEPGLVIKDNLDNVTFFKDYQDYINQIEVFGGNVTNHSRLNEQEFYSWDPHIDWDKFVNFQNYYWLPYGPDVIKIAGQQEAIVSTYKVAVESQGDNNTYIFSPDGLTRNPTLKLFRGQTYKFEITSPGNPFSIKTLRTPGSLDRYINASLSSHAVTNGTITFTVPYDAPDILFYMSETDIDLGGVFEIFSITENTKINVETEILGKKTYTLPDGTSLSNGMKVSFVGTVTPAEYATGQYYVEGVGNEIKLINQNVLELVSAYTDSESVLFDATPFDKLPFSDATSYAGSSDYIVINRSSKDHNPWSRYNRWFHKSVIEASAIYNGKTPEYDQTARAVRPIIEFEADLRLYNFGTSAIDDVDLIDTFTTDVFSTIEGSLGYNIDGIALAQGQRILFTADTDIFVKNKIYKVDFVVLNGVRQVHLIEETTPVENNVVLVKQGVTNQGLMYWYDGSTWSKAQQKSTLNQPPLFDVVDEDGVSYSDKSVYDGSTFAGTKLFSYKVGTGTADANLGFALSYKNISNIGDIVFNFNLATDSFQYKDVANIITPKINVGYLVKTNNDLTVSYKNGWQKSQATNTQAALRIYKNSNKTNNFDLDIFDNIYDLNDLVVRVYINGIRLEKNNWQLVDGVVYKKIVLNTDIALSDVLTIRAFAAQAVNQNGHYEIPINLQNNPLNSDMTDFTLGEVIDHVNSIVDNLESFSGSFPGAGNIRDLGNVTPYGTKFVQHSGPASLSLYHITSSDNNIVRAIEKSRDDYNKFKRSFIITAETLGVDADPEVQIELIMQKINKDKPTTSPYYFSDMVPYGAKNVTEITVVDYRIKLYPLSSAFDLTKLSSQAVIVYLNGKQLLHTHDYTFDSQGFVVITATLANDDVITIYEFDNTNGCFVPPTPTKLGIWPKYEPKLYLDTSLVTPRWMIQGHDGSQVLAYGSYGEGETADFRDALILELEKRIYNNIKVEYNKDIFDIVDFIPSYVRDTAYDREEFDLVLAPQFYKWLSLVDRDFTKPLSYNRENPLTYNYKGCTAPDGRNTPGYWKGIYRWMLDTDRPNLTPWEMLGLSEEPSWWVSTYGPAPYTSDNLPMWQDLANGVLREPGVPPVVLTDFVRPFLMDCIPVDELGNPKSPLNSGLSRSVLTQDIANDFVFGDVSPVESTWRRSSHYPFAVLITAILLQPAKTFGTLLDRSRIVRNLAGQLIYKDTGLRITPASMAVPSIYSSTTTIQTAGIINYVVDYILSDNLKSYTGYKYDLINLDAQLSYRVGGFTSKEKFNLLLDSKTPLSQSSVFVPQENYKIILNSSSPVKKITYSGVIVTKTPEGYEVKGYSKTQPYFKYYAWIQSGITINVGGISESYVAWAINSQYAAGKIVEYNGKYYRVKTLHTTTDTFNSSYYQSLAELPIIGGKDATLRKAWDKTNPIVVPYGTRFTSVQEVVDFLLGYGEWLKDQGFIFDDFNTELGAVTNWETSAKEFLFWTTQNWSTGEDKWDDFLPTKVIPFGSIIRYNGDYYRAIRTSGPSEIFNEDDFVKLEGLSTVGSSVISLSPSAAKLTFSTPLSVVDDIRNTFNGYEIFRVDGAPIAPNFLNSYREDNAVSYTPVGEDGIYGASFFLVQKEQVVILDNTTLFNDTIYNLESGYRQERIKVSGYVSTDWYGGFNVPGFIFDQAKIQDWTPWTDYALGDIVKYKEFYYSAGSFLLGSEKFNSKDWIKLDKKPTQDLLPNWTYKAEQFTDFYSLDSDNFDANQQAVAQHLIGYQKRQYLHNIIKDDVSEFKFYQGMIVEKGTQNVLNKLFDVLSVEGQESLTFYEEWALRVGQYGASAAFENIEFTLDESLFKINPQGFQLVGSKVDALDFIIRQTPNDVYLKPLGYNNNPWPVLTNDIPFLRSAGYVRPDEVKLTVATIDDILTQDITDFKVGDCIWVGFEGDNWNVYRYTDANLKVINVTYSSTDKELTVALDTLANVPVGSILGINQVSFNGFYKVKSTLLNDIILTAELDAFDEFVDQDKIVITVLKSQRSKIGINGIDAVLPETLEPGELVWTDNNGSDWATWKYNPVYDKQEILSSTSDAGLQFGRQIAINYKGTISLISNGLGEIGVYDKVTPKSDWIQRQVIPAPFISLDDGFGGSPTPDAFTGDIIAISPDGKWLATGTPRAGGVCSKFVGAWASITSYQTGDIVRVSTTPYVALQTSTNKNPESQPSYWKKLPYIPVDLDGENSSLYEQGVISLYEKDETNNYTLVDTILSPSPDDLEQFGSSIVFGNNTVFVGASGFNSNTGAVYQLSYLTTVKASKAYNPIGSSGTTVVLSNTTDIEEGMVIRGTGFTSEQVVVAVNSLTNSIVLSAEPDSEPSGILNFTTTNWQLASDVKLNHPTLPTGSNYGRSMTISNDGSTLVVSAPGTNQLGKVFVYKSTDGTIFSIDQTISGTDVGFGEAVTVSATGTFIAVSSILSDGDKIDQGSVIVYELSNDEYVVKQSLYNRSPEQTGLFGSKISFMNDYETIVVYSKNADSFTTMTFNKDQQLYPTTSGLPTTFDDATTTFITKKVNGGRIDVYDMYDTSWVFSESLPTESSAIEKYGQSIAVGANHVTVGVPYAADSNGIITGKVYDYVKSAKMFSWTKLHSGIKKLDPSKIKKAFLYNKETNKFITYLDVIDSVQGKIPGPADQEIKYKTFYDPAVYSYNVGSDSVRVDEGLAWASSQVGMLWWDLRTAKFYDSYDADPVYRNSTWNTLFPGASIDIYEWVGTKYTPEEWDTIADTENGIALGISGKSLYGANVYSRTTKYDNVSKTKKYTYYFWVKNKTTVPDIPFRTMSGRDVASLIENPRGQGYKYLALTNTDSFSLVNVGPLLQDKNVVLSVEYWLVDNVKQNIHSQWKLISSNEITNIPQAIEQKWIDSLCGKDESDRVVPDSNLPVKLRYGIENRPRQSMFVNRFEALKQLIEQVNRSLISQQITSQRDISNLEKYDAEPSVISALYDAVFDTDAELRFANVNTFSTPSLQPVIVNGRITSVNITNKGRGYGKLVPTAHDIDGNAIEWKGPDVQVSGVGSGAMIETRINTQGQIISANVISSGQGYLDSTTLNIRNYSVLVKVDSGASNTWSIYTYEPTSKVWSRVQSQSYDTRKYWNYADWFATGYNSTVAPDYAVNTLAELVSIQPAVGSIVLIRKNNSGYWTLLRRYANVASVDWTQNYEVVGVQNGTIQFSSSLYQFSGTTFGYDGSLYDGSIFDNSASTELRIILTTLRDKIFVDTLKEEYLKLFFTSLRYVLSEQGYIDWAFKTSFVRAKHNVGELKQKVTYNNDNLSNFEDYVAEVKPYRTKIREYVSAYDKVDNSPLSVTDFDLPPVYDVDQDTLVSITTGVYNGGLLVDNPAINSYPWKHWLDNVGFEVTQLTIVDGGSGYQTEPVVRFISNSGSGATARALIANGKVNRIVLLSKGKGYLSAPTVIIDGGVAVDGTPATVVAKIGNSVVRSNFIKMKFDRLTQTYFITQMQETETFSGDDVVSGSRLQFPLKWAPDIRIGKSTVTVNGVEELRANYKLAIAKSTSRGYTSYSGTITFNTAPAKGSTVVISYIKDWSLLNAADRIQYYYNPESGSLGKDLAQLMTGVDYGGVNIHGLNFDVASGWDSVPYYTDKWGAYDTTFDDYITTVAAGDYQFQLPYTPEAGTELNFYLAKFNEDVTPTDPDTTVYEFNVNDVSPKVFVTRDVAVSGVTAEYTSHSGTTLVVTDTTGIEPGMSIFGPGFTSGQTVISVDVDGVTLVTSSSPNVTPGVGADIYFTFNIAGTDVLTIDSTTGLKVGDVITITPFVTNMLGYQTKISAILNSIQVKLDQILFVEVLEGSTATFTRQLIEPTDCTINANGTVFLTEPLIAGSFIKISSLIKPVRIDDPNYGSPELSNTNAVMLTVIADGTTDTFEIPPGITSNNDQIIIRKSTSDGSIKPAETDYDTALSGGDWGYQTATGLRAEDIIVDGDGFVTPTSSPATEEVVPGQIVDAVAIKVFDRPSSGSASIKVDSYNADGETVDFLFTQQPNSAQAVIVKITEGYKDPATDELASSSTILTVGEDYLVDYQNQKVTFNVAPTAGQLVSIFNIGFNGSNILDLDYFVGDGTTLEFITKAPWLDDVTYLIYVNGVLATALSPELFRTDTSYESAKRIGIRFAIAPLEGDLINYVIVSGNQQTFAITKTERISTDGSLTYDLQYPVGDSLPAESNMIVRVDQEILQGPVNSYFTITGTKLNYTLDTDKFVPYSVSIADIVVLADGKALNPGTDYIIDLSGITIKISNAVRSKYLNKELIVSVRQGLGYTYVPPTAEHGPQITFAEAYDSSRVVEVISSYQHDILDIQRGGVTITANQVLTPDTLEYYVYKSLSYGKLQLDRTVINDNYVWVIRNGTLLTPSVDFKLNVDRKSITLAFPPDINDTFTLMTFGSNVLTSGIAYMQFKDMLNRVHFKRLSVNKQTKLVKDLRYTDTTIEVEDASNFDLPNPAKNKPGVIEIRGERIEYFTLNGNILGQLRRGTLGTGTPAIHRANAIVQDIGPSETVPYSETTVIEQVTSDGTNIVPLTMIPMKRVIESGHPVSTPLDWVNDGYETTYTSNYYQGDDIEVFVGGYTSVNWNSAVIYKVNDIVEVGSYTYRCSADHISGTTFDDVVTTISFNEDGSYNINETGVASSTVWAFFIGNIRLKKKPYKVHNVNVHSESPEGDVSLDAEFVVDGESNSLILTNVLEFGTRVTVVQRTGTDWDGRNSPNIQYDTTKIAQFLKATPGVWYTGIDKYDSIIGSGTSFDSENGTFDSTSSTFDQG